MDALIGHTGFVGSNLAAQRTFEANFNSKTIDQIQGREFDTVVCAGVQAQKWWANQNPEADWDGIQALIDRLSTVTAKRFVLISTVDVFLPPVGFTERQTDIDDPGLHAYGKNRLRLEEWVADHFEMANIVRLPALFGPGLKKNIIFDLMTDNQVEKIVPNSSFQWYALSRLGADLATVEAQGIDLVQLVPEPLPTQEILTTFFPDAKVAAPVEPPPSYDLKTEHAAAFGGANGYIASRDSVLAELGDYLKGAR
ncbi:NAD(P)-dependent oxidoreductase [Phenylobacterium immobile]|uniref:NAD(P)-dependent oxidoreductase n=1 Tax=Phenylobacterium immobile TaxID=21 RepID=UPI000AD7810A|nr:NAD(P)-dependent oxidoreductase [Phenylobacterium immobile]